ncbi:MAG TPA: HAMP domain-containing sensor histidine kinase [Caulobacteraceae bacterium]|jgi:signal transduction histidine kinase
MRELPKIETGNSAKPPALDGPPAAARTLRVPAFLKQVRWPGGLSSRLLLFIAAFTLIAEVAILLPSLASYQERWLLERERAAEVASLAVEAAPEPLARDSQGFARRLVAGAGVTSIAFETDVRHLLVSGPMPKTPDSVDLTQHGLDWIMEPWRTLFGAPDRMVRVTVKPRFRSGRFIEIVLPAQPLKEDLEGVLLQTVLISLLVSLSAGGLVYGALAAFIVRPMARLTVSIEKFRADPEDPTVAPQTSGRRDEIGRIEEELGRMQGEVRQALRSRARLAALGEAVAKISHDLRNMLASAQMASERLATSGDPKVAKALPRLERALDRALSLAQNVLSYGRSEEPAPAARRILLRPAIEAAAEDAGLSPDGVRLEMEVGPRLQVVSDQDQLHRVLLNLMRNAREAIETTPERGGVGVVKITASKAEAITVLRVADDGPGLSEKARQRLFQPFAGSSRAGGAGLGLAISRELAQANGGDLDLVDSGPKGTTFEIRLPSGG